MRFGYLWLGFPLLLLSGCVRYGGKVPSVEVPLPLDIAGESESVERLYVLLPGMGDRVERFRDVGFLDISLDSPAHDEHVAWLATDAHFGYYQKMDLPRRFQEDILDRWPEARITLVGISLGGFGACVLARLYPERVDEVVLIAPYLGSPWFLRRRVAPNKLTIRPTDGPRKTALLENWQYLTANEHDHKITMLYGKRDPLALAAPLVRKRAPHVQMLSGKGSHKWTAWLRLWSRYLNGEAEAVNTVTLTETR